MEYAECPFKGGMNQLWRNLLLATSIENSTSPKWPYKKVFFSVAHHPKNVSLMPSISEFKKLIGYSDRFFAFTSDNKLYAWGSNATGILGDNTFISKSSPVLVAGNYNFKSMHLVTSSYIFGITSDNQLYSWGSNSSGILGVGDILTRNSPTLVIGGYSWRSIAGATNIQGITTNNDLYGWGPNANGELGLGDTLNRSSPTLLAINTNYIKIDSITHTAYLTNDGKLYTCGDNDYGQLGLGDTLSRSIPTLVAGTWKDFFITPNITCALNSDGNLYAWGYNDTGVLGVGDILSKSTPTLVLGGLNINSNSFIYKKQIRVTPGQTYTLDLNVNACTSLFGNDQIAPYPSSCVDIEFY